MPTQLDPAAPAGPTSWPRRLLAWIEDGITWLVSYPLLPLQLLLLLLISWGGLGAELGLDDLFWDERAPVQFLNGLIVGWLFGQVLFVRYVLDADRERCQLGPSLFPVRALAIRGLGRFLSLAWPIILLALMIPRLLTTKFWEPGLAAWPMAAGLSLSVVSAVLAVAACEAWGWRGAVQSSRFFRWLPGVASGFIPSGDEPLHALSTLAGLALIVVFLPVLGIVYFGWIVPPVLVLGLILGLFNALFGFFAFHLRGAQHVLIVVLVVLAGLANYGRPYKMRFPNLDYEHLARLDGDGTVDHYRRLIEQSDHSAAAVGLVPSDAPLKAMHERWRAANPGRPASAKPRLVLIAVSGGGIRAAVWTATVLEGLEREVPPFRGRIRLFAGASGGMVGAALYVSEFDQPLPVGAPSVSDRLARDSLSPAVQTMLLNDLPALWLPLTVRRDRGIALEEAWDRLTRVTAEQPSPLARPFRDLADLERTGLRPSLIFTPMLVEDARRLLISNLDLADLTETHCNRLVPETGTPGEYDKLLSLPAVEFRRLFPTATGFTLTTAARMNASFPFVSPGVSLPTEPPRRVVDAGYFDNYGVNLAALWAYRHRDAIRQYTSGVLLVEIRAYRTGFTRRYFQDADNERAAPDGTASVSGLHGEETAPADLPRRPEGLLTRTLTFLSTPMEALLANWSRGAYYRDDELLGLLHEEFNGPKAVGRGVSDSFFTTVAFECGTDAALSWKLPAYELKNLRESFYNDGLLGPQVGRQVKAVEHWLGPRGDGPDRMIDQAPPTVQYKKSVAPARAAPPPKS